MWSSATASATVTDHYFLEFSKTPEGENAEVSSWLSQSNSAFLKISPSSYLVCEMGQEYLQKQNIWSLFALKQPTQWSAHLDPYLWHKFTHSFLALALAQEEWDNT